MENKQTAVEWIINEVKSVVMYYPDQVVILDILEKAKQIEADKEFETKQYWFGRGVLAGKEDRISELKPKRNYGKSKTT